MAFPDYPKAKDEGLPNGNASSRLGHKVKKIVIHVAAGYYLGTIAWFNRPNSDSNAHYLVGRLPGELCQFVDEDWAAWHSYPVNEESIGIEHADDLLNRQPGWMTRWQFEASAQLSADICKRHGLNPMTDIVRHSVIGWTTHDCPGPHFPLTRYRERVREIMRGEAPARPPAPKPSSKVRWIN